jgi:hypothetical protein
MTGTEFSTAVEEINGGDPIASTLRFQFGNLGKNLIEQRWPWMILRKTETSKTVATSNTWQPSIDLSTISDFSGFYQIRPIHSRHPTAMTRPHQPLLYKHRKS